MVRLTDLESPAVEKIPQRTVCLAIRATQGSTEVNQEKEEVRREHGEKVCSEFSGKEYLSQGKQA